MSLDIQKNELHYYVDLLRMSNTEQLDTEKSKLCVKALHNVIRTMNLSRNSKVCNEDFSHLDFGNIILNNISFSDYGKNPSSFRSSKLNEWNVRGGLIGRIFLIEFSDNGDYLLTFCNDGKVVVWDMTTYLLEEVIDTYTPFIADYYGERYEDIYKPIIFDLKKTNEERKFTQPNKDNLEKIKEKYLYRYFQKEKDENKSKIESHKEIISRFLTINQDISERSCDLQYSKLIISGDYRYAILKAFEKNYLFEISSGKILSVFCGEYVSISCDSRYYAYGSSDAVFVMHLENNVKLFDINRSVKGIIAVDIDLDKQEMISKAIGDSLSKSSHFIWNIYYGRFVHKSMTSDRKRIEYMLHLNPDLQTEDVFFNMELYDFLSFRINKVLCKERENVTYDMTKNEDFDMFFWELHYAADESFYITIEYNERSDWFQVVYSDRRKTERNFMGEIISAVLTDNDENFYFVTSEGIIYCYNIINEKIVFEKHIEAQEIMFIRCGKFSEDASYVFVGTDMGTVHLIDVETGKVIERFIIYIH